MQNSQKINPILLSQMISQFGPPYDSIPFQSFRGIYNKSKEGRKGYICFAISFFQLIFHSEDVKTYLSTENLQNSTEILLSDILSKITSNRQYISISIKNFLSKWKGWCSSDGLLVNDSEDISEFCQYLLYSCSEKFQNLFSIKLNEESAFPQDSVYYPNYFLRLEISNSNIQDLINIYTQKHKILQLPKNLLLYLPRIYGTKFFKNDIIMNSYIKVNNINYKFVGCSIFLGKYPKGHYITYIKFFDKYVQFDDELVSNLFCYRNCPSQTLIDIKNADNRLTKRSVFIYYAQYNGQIQANDWSKTEILFNRDVQSMYYGDPTINSLSNQINHSNLISNTFNLLNSQTISPEQLNRAIIHRNNSPSRTSALIASSNNSPSSASALIASSNNSPSRTSALRASSNNSPSSASALIASSNNSPSRTSALRASSNNSPSSASALIASSNNSPSRTSALRASSNNSPSRTSALRASSNNSPSRTSALRASSNNSPSRTSALRASSNNSPSRTSALRASSNNSPSSASALIASSNNSPSRTSALRASSNNSPSSASALIASSNNSPSRTSALRASSNNSPSRTSALRASSNNSPSRTSALRASSNNSPSRTSALRASSNNSPSRTSALRASSNNSPSRTSALRASSNNSPSSASALIASSNNSPSRTSALRASSNNSPSRTSALRASSNNSPSSASALIASSNNSPSRTSALRASSNNSPSRTSALRASSNNSPSRTSALRASSNNSPSRTSALRASSNNSPSSASALIASSNNSPSSASALIASSNNRTIQTYPQQEEETEKSQEQNDTNPFADLIQVGNNAFISEQTVRLSLNSEESLDEVDIIVDDSNESFSDTGDLENHMQKGNNAESSNSINQYQIIEQQNHLLLHKDENVIDETVETNLYGKLVYNSMNIPADPKDRTEPSKFLKYRKIFKIIGKILRKLNFADQGQTNSEILLDKLHVEKANGQEIVAQGEKLYDIIKKNVNEDQISVEKIMNDFDPIFEWYKQRFHLDPYQKASSEYVIDETLPNSHEIFANNINAFDIDMFLNGYNYQDDLPDDVFSIEEEEEEEEEYIGLTTTDDEEESINEIDQDPGVSSVLNITNAHEFSNSSHTKAALQSILNDIYNWMNLLENDFAVSDYAEDDNHCIAECYFWKDRMPILNIEEIIQNIREKMTQKKQNLKGMNLKISQLRILVERDIYRAFVNDPNNKYNIENFARTYLKETNVIETTPSSVFCYKLHKGIPLDKNVMSQKNLQNKLYKFIKLPEEKKKQLLEYHPELASHGGFRKENVKVTDETIKCLVTLIIDFPNLSARAITSYINSPFGTNYENPLDHRTIQRYMNNLEFTFKQSSFSPPNRNSIGLRIFRVAWCKIIEKVISNDNVLIGFIDEASITTNEGPKKGRSFIGITPVVNCPLSKVKVSVLSLVLPGFGVLYQFYDGSVNNIQYSNFLKETVRFIRKHICNNKTEIIFIEDNCPIHSTSTVENTIQNLKIALIPIVPYSPSLNGVVEGLFSYVKNHFFRVIEQTDEDEIKNEIKDNWREIINKSFDLKEAHSLYKEWILRMKQCKNGQPIYSGHVEDDNSIQIDFNRLQYITVDRIKT